MANPLLDREELANRFHTNMRRIGDITKHVHSGAEDLKNKKPFQSEGVRADILRALVVFLHATFEDIIRSQFPKPNKKFTFYSNADLRKALRELRLDTSFFEYLFPPLTRMAKRKNGIVHHADLKDDQSSEVAPWTLGDDWQLMQWNVAVLAFYFRLRKATGYTNVVEDRARENMEAALIQLLDSELTLVNWPKLPPNKKKEVLDELDEQLGKLGPLLDFNVEMFLTPEGEPLEGVMESIEQEDRLLKKSEQ